MPMSYSVGEHFDQFIREQVASGRYNNSSEVVREGLRLVEEREARLISLRAHIEQAVTRGGAVSDDELAAALASDTE